MIPNAGGVHPRTPDHDRVRYEFVLADAAAVPGPVGGTVMFGIIEDASHLHGLLDRFSQLGLTVLEMRRLPD